MPEINNISGTAFIIAEFRAEENEASEPLYTDKIVKLFLDQETKQIADQVVQSFPAAKEMVKLRTRYFDDILTQQIALGCKQVVILGSGLDTRAVRMPAAGVRYFEIEQESTLQLKAERLKVNLISADVTYISGDYLKNDLIELLKKNEFDFHLPTYFIWEGNVTYLKKTDIIFILKQIRDNVINYKLSLDYMSHQVITKTTGYTDLNEYIEQLEQLGASWITGFNDIITFTRELGLNVIDHLSAEQLYNRYRPHHPLIPHIFEFYFVCTLENKPFVQSV